MQLLPHHGLKGFCQSGVAGHMLALATSPSSQEAAHLEDSACLGGEELVAKLVVRFPRLARFVRVALPALLWLPSKLRGLAPGRASLPDGGCFRWLWPREPLVGHELPCTWPDPRIRQSCAGPSLMHGMREPVRTWTIRTLLLISWHGTSVPALHFGPTPLCYSKNSGIACTMYMLQLPAWWHSQVEHNP